MVKSTLDMACLVRLSSMRREKINVIDLQNSFWCLVYILYPEINFSNTFTHF